MAEAFRFQANQHGPARLPLRKAFDLQALFVKQTQMGGSCAVCRVSWC